MPSKNKKLSYAIGVDLGGTNVRVGIISSAGKVLYSAKNPIPRKRTRQTLPILIGNMIEKLIQIAEKKRLKIKGIGFGSPGILNMKKGIVNKSPNLPEWKNYPLAHYFKIRFSLPFVLENDANAAALGEAWVGAGKKAKTVICVTLGTGIGGGLILDNQLWHGVNDGGGEIGHMVVRDHGKKCRCGNRGCLEIYASASAIVKQAKTLLKKTKTKSKLRGLNKITSADIYRCARSGDKLAGKITREAAEILGAGLTSLVHIFNPEMIIIGGGVSQNGALLFKPLRKEVKKRAFPQLTRHLKILPAKLGDHAGMIGAARAFFLSNS